jgi:hypothetical protein
MLPSFEKISRKDSRSDTQEGPHDASNLVDRRHMAGDFNELSESMKAQECRRRASGAGANPRMGLFRR